LKPFCDDGMERGERHREILAEIGVRHHRPRSLNYFCTAKLL
jgi:hypothetical protein